MAEGNPSSWGGFTNFFPNFHPWETEEIPEKTGCVCSTVAVGTCQSCNIRNLQQRSMPQNATNQTEPKNETQRGIFDEEDIDLDGPLLGGGGLGRIAPDFRNKIDLLSAEAMGTGLPRRRVQNEGVAALFAETSGLFREREGLILRQPSGGRRLLGGRIFNSIMTDVDVPVAMNEVGQYFGGAELRLSQRRADILNGFGCEAITGYRFMPNFNNIGPQGFIKDCFIFDLGPSQTSIWADRISQTAANVDVETQGLCIWVNGRPAPIIHLFRRKEPYYFTFRNQNLNCQLSTDEIPDPADSPIYFTMDPIGGGTNSVINGYDPIVPTPGIMPALLPQTSLIYANGNTCALKIDNSFPDIFFYQCAMGPFMGGVVKVYGACP